MTGSTERDVLSQTRVLARDDSIAMPDKVITASLRQSVCVDEWDRGFARRRRRVGLVARSSPPRARP